MTDRKLGFGTMRLPLNDPDDSANIDIEQFKKMADIFMERGFTYFDTAYPYHKEKSEDTGRPPDHESFSPVPWHLPA